MTTVQTNCGQVQITPVNRSSISADAADLLLQLEQSFGQLPDAVKREFLELTTAADISALCHVSEPMAVYCHNNLDDVWKSRIAEMLGTNIDHIPLEELAHYFGVSGADCWFAVFLVVQGLTDYQHELNVRRSITEGSLQI